VDGAAVVKCGESVIGGDDVDESPATWRAAPAVPWVAPRVDGTAFVKRSESAKYETRLIYTLGEKMLMKPVPLGAAPAEQWVAPRMDGAAVVERGESVIG
jgi:hypothetical protein